MQTCFYPAADIPRIPRAVALGVFEGLHVAHRAVISEAVGQNGLCGAVFTFAGPLPKGDGGALMTADRRRLLLENMGVDEVFTADFAAIRDLSPADFVRQVLKDDLRAERVVCGDNFRFGKGGAGTVDTLRALCAENGITLTVVPAVTVENEPVSTTRIRRLLANGDIPAANRLLGFPFELRAPVVHGRRLAREWGMPTINQPLPRGLAPLRYGVYASAVEIDGRWHPGVTNIGVKPTVGAEQPLAETWIPGVEADLYDQTVRVLPLRFLRKEERFPSLDELREQIRRDADAALEAVAPSPSGTIRAVLFDFDDTLQDRGEAFGRYADWFFDRYFPDLNADTRAERRAEMLREQKGGYVDYDRYFALLIDRWNWQDAPAPAQLTRECRLTFSRCTALYPQSRAVMEECRRRGYRVGIVTNGISLLQNRKLDVCGLRPLCDVTLVSGDEGVHKPAPELFRRAAMLLGVAPRDCVYVGDHPINDVQGAVAAGMTPVYIHQNDMWAPPPDGVITVAGIGEVPDRLSHIGKEA
ncbi:MAG: riboflavin biosynthesis protein RibF [Acutalibacteraceae bacterium]|jgi:riboflavin kinase/FMN adenylyltransferase